MLLLVGALFGLMGFRLGLNNQNSNILDVGYASVVGADRLIDGALRRGARSARRTARPAAATARTATRSATSSPTQGAASRRSRPAAPTGRRSTLAYVAVRARLRLERPLGRPPAAHVAASAFDIAAVAGAVRRRVAAGVAPAGGACSPSAGPPTRSPLYALNLNTNDALVGALLAWTMALLARPAARGAMLALAALSKLAPFCLVPLMFSLRHRLATLAGFVGAASSCSATLLLIRGSLRTFWDETIGYQPDRVTPLSIWTLPALPPRLARHRLAPAGRTGRRRARGSAARRAAPRGRKDAAAVAALGGAAMLATQMVAELLVLPVRLLVAAAGAARPAAAPARAPGPEPRRPLRAA